MSRLVRTHAAFLQLLYATNAKQRKVLLQTISNEQLKALCEVIWNVYKGTVPVSDRYVKKLTPYKTIIRSLISRRVGRKRKKIILVQRHSMIPWLLKPVLDMLNREHLEST